MNTHKYILQQYKGTNTRHRCPACQDRNKTFVRYVDTETGEYLADQVGRCDREVNCSYHYPPKQYFQDSGLQSHTRELRMRTNPSKIAVRSKPISFIPAGVFKDHLKDYEENNFAQFLATQFGAEITSKLISRYFIGTSKHWPGASIFWQIDIQGNIRTGKIMLYNAGTGRRVKEPVNRVTWTHKFIGLENFELQQCFFGEHLLKDKTKPVAIVESEKTAIIASIYLPQFIWVATGGLSHLTAEKCKVLKGRTVILYPDLKCFDKWNQKAQELSHLANFQVSDLLERKATDKERAQGLDLADYLLRLNLKEFTSPDLTPTQTAPKPADIVQYYQSTLLPEAEVKAVSARELFFNLGYTQSDWTNWYKEYIVENHYAIKNEDWIELPLSGSKQKKGWQGQDFTVTKDFAIRLAMMAETAQGHQIRDYYIRMEEEAKKIEQRPMSAVELLAYFQDYGAKERVHKTPPAPVRSTSLWYQPFTARPAAQVTLCLYRIHRIQQINLLRKSRRSGHHLKPWLLPFLSSQTLAD